MLSMGLSWRCSLALRALCTIPTPSGYVAEMHLIVITASSGSESSPFGQPEIFNQATYDIYIADKAFFWKPLSSVEHTYSML